VIWYKLPPVELETRISVNERYVYDQAHRTFKTRKSEWNLN
jgi:hypothetical protein